MTTMSTDTTALSSGSWVIDPAHSEVGFSVRHLGMSKVRGRFNSFAGNIAIGENVTESRVEATIDLSSVDTNNEARDGHLQSADFFNVETQPTMTFTSTAVTPTTLTGELSINGVTRSVELDLDFHGVANDPYDTTRAGFSASGEISRREFGMEFNAPFGLDGMLVSDKVTVELEIQAVPAN